MTTERLRRTHAIQISLGIEPKAPWLAKLLALFLQPGNAPDDSATRQVQRLFPHVNFNRLRFGDIVRIPLQLLALLLIRFNRPARPPSRSRARQRQARRWFSIAPVLQALNHLLRSIFLKLLRLFRPITILREQLLSGVCKNANTLIKHSIWQSRTNRVIFIFVAAILAFLPITTPLEPVNQALFAAVLLLTALIARRVTGRGITLFLIILSVFTSTRYIWWRLTYTTYWDDTLSLTWGTILITAEVYAWVMLMFTFFQSAWPLQRKPAPLPANHDKWPTVDVYIPTYNEPITVVGPTVLAALAIDWPHDKLRVYLLDDGRREEMRDFAAEVGAQYITRSDNQHAKAGNLNHALRLTDGEYITIFDCDHVPTSSFLTSVMGWFLRDKRLALVQTPHHFFSPDPFERNLHNFRKMPSEGVLFHNFIQDGNDLWNSTFFCGSCAVIRRGPLEEVGGIAIETVTEDAHTALRLQRRGYRTAMINKPLAAGLATESLSDHIGQRVRWARGMAQIFRIDNPFLGRGLSFAQRICYSSAMLYFFNGGPRLVFLTAPIAFLVFDVYVIHASALEITLYVLPHLLHIIITTSRMHAGHRRTFWSDVYDTVLAWYFLLPTFLALINPRYGKFNVTAKGGVIENDRFEWMMSRPLLILAGLNLICLGFGFWRLGYGQVDEFGATLINIAWTTFNLLILGAGIAVAVERAQRRVRHRAEITVPVVLKTTDNQSYPGQTVDITSDGAALAFQARPDTHEGDLVTVSFNHDKLETIFTGRVIALSPQQIRLAWNTMPLNSESILVQCSLATSGVWSNWMQEHQYDQPMRGLTEVAHTASSGYRKLAHYSLDLVTKPLKPALRDFGTSWHSFRTLFPYTPALAAPAALYSGHATSADLHTSSSNFATRNVYQSSKEIS